VKWFPERKAKLDDAENALAQAQEARRLIELKKKELAPTLERNAYWAEKNAIYDSVLATLKGR